MTVSVPVVFIHGLGGASSVDYAHLAKGLSVHRRCLLVDLPGTADTPWPLVRSASCLSTSAYSAELVQGGEHMPEVVLVLERRPQRFGGRVPAHTSPTRSSTASPPTPTPPP